jgi:hypothetical protein
MRALGATDPAAWHPLLAGDFVELAKYALKFSELTPADNWQAFRTLTGRRLVDAFGWLRGVEVDPSLTDDGLDAGDAPYFEIVAKHLGGEYRQASRRIVRLADREAVEAMPEVEPEVAAAEVSFLR